MAALKQIAKATYDFDVDGGTAEAIALAVADIVPKNSVAVKVYTKCITACTSDGSATIAITAGGVTLAPATAFDNNAFDTVGQVSDLTALLNSDLGDVASSSAAIGITVATAALTAGKFDIYVEYIAE